MSTTEASLDCRPSGPARPSAPGKIRQVATGLAASIACLLIIAFGLRAAHAGRILDDVATLTAAIGSVAALHIAVIACDGMAWRGLLRREGRSGLDFLWARWVREATNLLLPVAQIGGEVVGARVLALRGTRPRLAGASVALDKLSEALSQIPFTLLGLLLMLHLIGRSEITDVVWLALAAVAAVLAAITLAPRLSGWNGLRRRVMRWLAGTSWRPLAQIAQFAQTCRAIYRPRRFALAMLWHLLGWLLSTGEIWLALRFLGHPLSLGAAIALESLVLAIIGIGFVVPAGLGVQEGAYVVIGGMLGLPPEAALALSLIKRARQLVLGMPALMSWQALELHRLLGTRLSKAAVAAAPASSHSNAYMRRFVRALLRPFRGTGLTPNAITWGRIATGAAACVACCFSGSVLDHAAALLWLASALLDRGDGEFARLTGQCSEHGRRLDYRGDVVVNALIFLAVGIHLRHGALGAWSIAIGASAMLAVACASVLAEALEMRIGEKTVPSRYGFDADDLTFLLVPILWLGQLTPLLLGAFVGGSAAALYIWRRLAHVVSSAGDRRVAAPVPTAAFEVPPVS